MSLYTHEFPGTDSKGTFRGIELHVVLSEGGEGLLQVIYEVFGI